MQWILDSRPGGVQMIAVADVVVPLESTDDDPSSPSSGWTQIGTIAGAAIGVWEHSVGVSTDVEDDEIFVILSGQCTVATADGDITEFGPGDMGRLEGGIRTTWNVHEPVRKVWVSVDG
jgi:uncharacterized cupin superfamily protein